MTSDELDSLVKRTLGRGNEMVTEVEGMRAVLLAKDDQIAALRESNAAQERSIEIQRETITALQGRVEMQAGAIEILLRAVSPIPQLERRQ